MTAEAEGGSSSAAAPAAAAEGAPVSLSRQVTPVLSNDSADRDQNRDQKERKGKLKTGLLLGGGGKSKKQAAADKSSKTANAANGAAADTTETATINTTATGSSNSITAATSLGTGNIMDASTGSGRVSSHAGSFTGGQPSPLITHKKHAGAAHPGKGGRLHAAAASGAIPPMPFSDGASGAADASGAGGAAASGRNKKKASKSPKRGGIKTSSTSAGAAKMDEHEATSGDEAISSGGGKPSAVGSHNRSASLPDYFSHSISSDPGAAAAAAAGAVGTAAGAAGTGTGSLADAASAATSDMDTLAPVDIHIDDDSPAAEALRANAAVSVSRFNKAARGINAQTLPRAVKRGMGMVKARSSFGDRRGKPPRVPAHGIQRSNSFGDFPADHPIHSGHLMSLAEEDEEGHMSSDLSQEAKAAMAAAGAAAVGIDGEDLETQSLPEKMPGRQHVSFAAEPVAGPAADDGVGDHSVPEEEVSYGHVGELDSTVRAGQKTKLSIGDEEEKTEVEPADAAALAAAAAVGAGAAVAGAVGAAAAAVPPALHMPAPLDGDSEPDTISPLNATGMDLIVDFPTTIDVVTGHEESPSIGKTALSRLRHSHPASPDGEKSAKSHRSKETRFARSLDKHLSEQLRRKKRKKEKLAKRKSYVRGKVIDGKHELYTLSIAVMLGLRTSISQTNKQLMTNASSLTGTDKHRHQLQWLDGDDFMAVEKYEFRPRGTDRTPPHKLSHTFKFKDYSPLAFAYIRRMFGVNEYEFLSSVCGNANFIEFISNAKSGQFFFYSHDGRYMIKTMTNAESKFLRRILPHYFRHCCQNPNTLLTKFLGMYRVKLYHLRRNVKFIIMNSVFDTDKHLQNFFDLKGSVTGREAKPGEEVKKDNDVRAGLPESAFALPPEICGRMREQVLADCNFLKEMKIMDYSMLIGVHHIPAGTSSGGVAARKSGGASVSSASTSRKGPMGRNSSIRSTGGGSGGGGVPADTESLASSTGPSLRSMIGNTLKDRPATKAVTAAGEVVGNTVFPKSTNDGAEATAAAAEIRRDNPSSIEKKSSYLSDAGESDPKSKSADVHLNSTGNGLESGSINKNEPESSVSAPPTPVVSMPIPPIEPVLSSESKVTAPSAIGGGIDGVLSDRSITSYSTMDMMYYDDDDDYSYLEGTFTRKKNAMATGATASGGSVDDWDRFDPEMAVLQEGLEELERRKEEATEQMYWPFHRLYNVHGRRRMVPLASDGLDSNDSADDLHVLEGDDAATAVVENKSKNKSAKEHCSCPPSRDSVRKWPTPKFVTPISNRKDGGLVMDTAGFELPLRRVDAKMGKIQYYEGKIFYMGIIDVLQQFNIRKRVEARWRRLQGGGWQDASCVHPDLYADRFVRFFDEYSQRMATISEGDEEQDDADLENVEEVVFYKNEGDRSDRSLGEPLFDEADDKGEK